MTALEGRIHRLERVHRSTAAGIDWRRRLAEHDREGTPLTPRWNELSIHVAEQQRLRESRARVRWIAAGRRGGKTEHALRGANVQPWPAGVQGALHDDRGGWWVYAAPTRDQAKRLFWRPLRGLVPAWAVESRSDSELSIRLRSGATILVAGLDVPERLEGIAIRWAGVDEIAKVKPSAWHETIYPALSTRGQEGSAWLFGKPKGRNHFYDLFQSAAIRAAAARAEGLEPEEDVFHWVSAEVLDPKEVARAKRELPARIFREEYEASFENMGGAVYYAFERDIHAAQRLTYDRARPLIVALDWNVRPGVAVLAQDIPRASLPQHEGRSYAPWVTCVIGELWLEQSHTALVCDELLARIDREFRDPALVEVYGDATGGARSTTSTQTDWDIVQDRLRPSLGGRLKIRRRRSNPEQRARINAMNGRLRSTDGTVGMLVDPVACPRLIQDLEGVEWKQTATREEIDKPAGTLLTHLSDAIGYFVADRHPIRRLGMHEIVPI